MPQLPSSPKWRWKNMGDGSALSFQKCLNTETDHMIALPCYLDLTTTDQVEL